MAKLPPVLIAEAPKESKLAAGMASFAFLNTPRSDDVLVTRVQPVAAVLCRMCLRPGFEEVDCMLCTHVQGLLQGLSGLSWRC